MNPRGEQVLFSIWGNQEGYASISLKSGGKWEDKIFQWPQQKEDIKEFLKHNNSKANLYWCPTLLKEPRRIKDNVLKSSILWADIDEAVIKELEPKPSICWETSPGRYQGLWLLSKRLEPSKLEKLNKNLTYTIGADKGGWDLTQVLRVPGTTNYNYDEEPEVKLLWVKKDLKYQPEYFKESQQEQTTEFDIEPKEELKNLIFPYKDMIDKRTWEMLFTPELKISVGERSDRLWELECRLLEAGVPVNDIIQIVKLNPWNKFKGRRDEDKRILSEVLKAESEVKSKKFIISSEQSREFIEYADFMGSSDVGPKWLVEGIWMRESHGMIAGEPKAYKSVLTTDLAVSVASGKPFLGSYEVKKQGPVLIIQEENAPWIVRDRLKKITNARDLLNSQVSVNGKNIQIKFPPPLPIHLLNNAGLDITSEEDKTFVESNIKEYKPILVILDPLYLMMGDKDVNSAKDLQLILPWLKSLRDKYNTSVVLVHHWNKAGASKRGGQRMLGSTTLHGWVDSALYSSLKDENLGKVSLEREFRSFAKRPPLDITISLEDPGQLGYDTQTQEGHTTSSSTKSDVIGLLNNTVGMTIGELAAMLDWTQRQVRYRLEQLTKQEVVFKEKSGSNTIWKLNENFKEED